MQLIPTSANGFGHNLNENLGLHEKGCQSRSCRTMPLVGPSTKQVNRSMCFPKELAGFSYMHMLPTSFVLCLINHMSVFSNIWIHFPFFYCSTHIVGEHRCPWHKCSATHFTRAVISHNAFSTLWTPLLQRNESQFKAFCACVFSPQRKGMFANKL